MNSSHFSNLLKQLLSEHNVVALPGMGYFEMKDIPSEIVNNGTAITPPSRKIVFESSSECTNNLLAEAYANETGIGVKEAEAEIADFLKEFKKRLINKGEAEIPYFGSVCYGEAGSFVFKADPIFDVEADSYCLETVSLKVNSELSGGDPVSAEDTAALVDIEPFDIELVDEVVEEVSEDTVEEISEDGVMEISEDAVEEASEDAVEENSEDVVEVEAEETTAEAAAEVAAEVATEVAAEVTAEVVAEIATDATDEVVLEPTATEPVVETAELVVEPAESVKPEVEPESVVETAIEQVIKPEVETVVEPESVSVAQEMDEASEVELNTDNVVELSVPAKQKPVNKVLIVVGVVVAVFVVCIILLFVFKEQLMPMLEKLLYSPEELEVLRQHSEQML